MDKTSVSPGIAYHLGELKVARNPAAPARCMPQFSPADRTILDVGCGIGQTFVAAGLGPDRRLVGLDMDIECLQWGRTQFPHIEFIHGAAERLPFAEESFDLVVSRVTLLMTDIPRSLREIERVLKSGGRVWFTLHPISRAMKEMKDALRKRSIKDILFRGYVIANGVWFHFFGRQFRCPFKRSRIETFQTERSIQRCMRDTGFTDVRLERGRHFVCTASKKRPAATQSASARALPIEPSDVSLPTALPISASHVRALVPEGNVTWQENLRRSGGMAARREAKAPLH